MVGRSRQFWVDSFGFDPLYKAKIMFNNIACCAGDLSSSFCAFYLCGVYYRGNEDISTGFAQILVSRGLLVAQSWEHKGVMKMIKWALQGAGAPGLGRVFVSPLIWLWTGVWKVFSCWLLLWNSSGCPALQPCKLPLKCTMALE